MLDIDSVNRIAAETAANTLRHLGVVRVSSEPMVDHYGDDGLSVLIVLAREPTDADGRAAVDTLHEISQALLAAGEDRFPFLSYATSRRFRQEHERLRGRPDGIAAAAARGRLRPETTLRGR